MWIAGFVTMVALYSLYAAAAYTSFRANDWYIPACLVISNITNFIWAYLSKGEVDINRLYYYTMIWDVLYVVTFAIVPMFFGVKLTLAQWCGVVLAITGLIMMKA